MVKKPVPIDAVSLAAVLVAVAGVCTVVGWTLSLAGGLTRAAYVVAAITGLMVGSLVLRKAVRRGSWRPRRLCRGLPAGFLVIWSLATLGGALYAPSNIDALTYRLPRVLHWLDAGRWHWIDTDHVRMNYNATGAEWLAAPVLALTHSARLLFLANAAAFLLLPGLMFVWLRGLGVGGKAAWRWMWLTPAALGFAMQCGSLGNDLPGALYFLAAAVFAWRGARSGCAGWLVLSAVALGLMTNEKISNGALVPALAVIWIAGWRNAGGGWMRSTGMALIAGAAVSALPTLGLNAWHTGSITGDPANLSGVQTASVSAALAGNATLTTLQNFAPPFCPMAAGWNAWSSRVLLPAWQSWFGPSAFPRLTFRLGELPQEEWAGFGLCFGLLLILSWSGRPARGKSMPRLTRQILWAGAAGVLLYAGTMGSEMPARLMLPFLPLLVAAVALRSPDRDPWSSGAWRATAGLTIITAALAVVLTPARPLFPAARVFTALERMGPSPWITRAARVYRVYGNREDVFASLRGALQERENEVGFFASDDDAEWSLWRPWGARRIVHVGPARPAPVS